MYVVKEVEIYIDQVQTDLLSTSLCISIPPSFKKKYIDLSIAILSLSRQLGNDDER